MAVGPGGGFVGGARGGGGGGACGVGAGEECTACGVGCGGGNGALAYVGTGQGEYIQETNYKYVGFGGDFDNVRPRRDFTCIICLPLLLLLIPLLYWLFSGSSTSQPYDC